MSQCILSADTLRRPITTQRKKQSFWFHVIDELTTLHYTKILKSVQFLSLQVIAFSNFFPKFTLLLNFHGLPIRKVCLCANISVTNASLGQKSDIHCQAHGYCRLQYGNESVVLSGFKFVYSTFSSTPQVNSHKHAHSKRNTYKL